MPRIIRAGVLNLADDAVKIKDMVLAKPQKKPGKSPPKPDEFGGEMALQAAPQEDFDAQEFGYEEESAGYALKEEIIRGAMAEAARILEDAVQRAEEQKSAKLAEVTSEARQMRQEAAEEGRQEGMAQAIETVRQSAKALEHAIASFEGERASFEAEYEQQLKWTAIEIASKVMAKKVEDDDAEMAAMVEKAVASVRNEPWIRVDVAQEMTGLIGQLMALFEKDENVNVSPIPAQPGTVHIETPSGVVDASLHTQLANLREYFAGAI